jgi:hypothetical protein
MTMNEPPTRTEAVLDVLRRPTTDPAVFRGFGPLVVGVLFLLLMIALLPSVAPERIVEQPVETSQERDG